MAQNKKSFVLYADLIKSIDHLTLEEKGMLFQHLLEYVNDLNPILTDRLLITAWKPIELQLKRDLVKFEEVKLKRSDAGKRSAESRAKKSEEQNSTNPTSVESVEQTSTNPTDNVNDNDIDNVNDTVINNKNDLFYLDLVNSEMWLQGCAMNNTPKFNLIQVKEKLLAFKTDLNLKFDYKKNKAEFSSHFINWLNQQKNEKKTNYISPA